MEQADREKILRNLVQLVQIRNVNLFCTELIANSVFTTEMIEKIQCSSKSPREQVQQLFLDLCKRGPTAFVKVVRALGNTGNITEARLLDPNAHVAFAEQNVIRRDCDCSSAVPPIRPTARSPSKEQSQAYRLSSNPRGFALVINVVDFDGNPNLKRIGAENDDLSLRRMLKKFGYEVDVVLNPKKKDLLCRQNGILKKFTDRFNHCIVDSCIVVIMSHGEENFWIQTSDCESMSDDYAHLVHLWEDVFPRFNNQYLPIMRNKPKLFIVQSCRGERVHRRIRITPAVNFQHRIQTDSGRSQLALNKYYEHHPEFNHMMVLQSTLPGYVSIRHEEKGSPFIQIACQIFQQFGKQLTLSEMVPEVARRLQDLPVAEGGPQTCTFKTVGYVKPFIFIPPAES